MFSISAWVDRMICGSKDHTPDPQELDNRQREAVENLRKSAQFAVLRLGNIEHAKVRHP